MIDLDSFSGNSSSPVFNSDTGIVEGLMVRGNDDYKFSLRLNCSTTRYYRRNRFKNYGSDVMRITEIEMLKDKK